MHENVVLQNVFGTIGTIFWSGQIIPQIWKNWRRHSTEGLSPHLMLLWCISSLFLGVYNIVQNINVSLIVQPQTFGVLGAFCWIQCLYYGSKKSLRTCAMIFIAYLVLATAFEVGFVYAMRAAIKHHRPGAKGGLQFFGIASAVCVALGLLPQYFEIYQLKEVIGISYVFITIDLMGGVFSMLSLAFKQKWEVVVGLTYALVIVMDGLILLAALILNPLARRRRRNLQENKTQEGMTDLEKQVATELSTIVKEPETEAANHRSESDEQFDFKGTKDHNPQNVL